MLRLRAEDLKRKSEKFGDGRNRTAYRQAGTASPSGDAFDRKKLITRVICFHTDRS